MQKLIDNQRRWESRAKLLSQDGFEKDDKLSECVICCDAVSTVVFSPCNHLICCCDCFINLKDGYAAGLTCPLCR
jgi:hypothetical protein